MVLEDRKVQEAHFHDHLREEAPFQRWTRETEQEIGQNQLWSNFKYYSVERKSRRYVEDWVARNCAGTNLLDFGCDNGTDVLFAAQHGANATGIDISETSVQNATEAAREAGVSERAKFVVMDAEHMTFEDNTFDIVSIYGVLHHMEFGSAMAEIARVLKPGGRVIATEALAHNPLISAYRRRTPALRTEWETAHILRRENLQRAYRWFDKVDLKFFHLAMLAAVPFRNTPLFGPILSVTESLDAALLKIPELQWQAWQIVFTLGEPIKR